VSLPGSPDEQPYQPERWESWLDSHLWVFTVPFMVIAIALVVGILASAYFLLPVGLTDMCSIGGCGWVNDLKAHPDVMFRLLCVGGVVTLFAVCWAVDSENKDNSR